MSEQMMTQTPPPGPTGPVARRGPRAIPIWLSGLIILACLAAGGWLVWWFVYGSGPEGQTITFETQPRIRRDFGGRDRARETMRRLTEAAPPGVYFIRDNEWSVRTPSAAGRIQREGAQANARFTYSFAYKTTDHVQPEHAMLLRGRGEIVRSTALAQSLQITGDQAAALRKIQASTGAQLTDQDRERLTLAMGAYLSGTDQSPQSAGAKIVADLAEQIVQERRDGTAQVLAARAQEIASILKPQQIEQLRKRQPAQPQAAATTRP